MYIVLWTVDREEPCWCRSIVSYHNLTKVAGTSSWKDSISRGYPSIAELRAQAVLLESRHLPERGGSVELPPSLQEVILKV